MAISALAGGHVAHRVLGHLLGQRVPGTQVLPKVVVDHGADRPGLFHHGVVEADFGKLRVQGKKILVAVHAELGFDEVGDVPEPTDKYAAIPERALFDELCRVMQGAVRVVHAFFEEAFIRFAIAIDHGDKDVFS